MANLTVMECLKGISGYPIPQRVFEEKSLRRGLSLSVVATKEIVTSAPYRLCLADLYMWLSVAPSISQGGQNYSFDSEQRTWFRNEGRSIYEEYGENNSCRSVPYGYKGDIL